MHIRFSIERYGNVLASRIFEVTDVHSFQSACAEIWGLVSVAHPLADHPKSDKFLSTLKTLWGASMRLDNAD